MKKLFTTVALAKKTRRGGNNMRVCRTILIIAAALFLFLPAEIYAATIGSYFDSNSDGWQYYEVAQVTYNVTSSSSVYYSSTGGNPGGHIWGQDFSSAGWDFGAPSKYLGNKRTFIGGTVSFDLLTSGTVDPISIFWIRSPNILLIYTGFTPLTTSFTHYNVELNPGRGWGAISLDARGMATGSFFSPTSQDFLTAMSSISSIEIRGDWINGNELSRLDNFEMNSVPVPSAVLLLGPGLASLAGIRSLRRFRFNKLKSNREGRG